MINFKEKGQEMEIFAVATTEEVEQLQKVVDEKDIDICMQAVFRAVHAMTMRQTRARWWSDIQTKYGLDPSKAYNINFLTREITEVEIPKGNKVN